MIKRFSLYGFLKNQRYFEPFIILFFLANGLSFTQIGFLVGFREMAINLMEIPSGAVADLFGRRRCMILSFVSYITSFTIFGFSHEYWQFFVAMFFFSIGEAFRTGTHKSIIFTWLRLEGRSDEKTRVYGYTRSWSNIGSAVSVILAAVFVLLTKNYAYVFFFAILPYLAGLINFITYPKELEGEPELGTSLRNILRHLWECLKDSLSIQRLRRLIAESMGFEGVYKAVESYLQPVIKSLALMLPFLTGLGDVQRSAILVGAIYFAVHLASGYASRNSYRVTERLGGEEKGSRFLWKMILILYLGLVPLLFFEYYHAAILGFIVLALVQNFWRPVQISRFDAYATETQGATILSIESQAKSVSTMILAPIMGAMVDLVRDYNIGGDFWPVATMAVIITLLVLVMPLRRDK
ncbi:MAG: MFS transporter [Dehalococcoidia bacterium]